MGKVVLDMAMSLDGYIAGKNDEDQGLHNWFFTPDATHLNEAVVAESINSAGAILMGRRTYDIGDQANGFADTPYKAAHFVLTHQPPAKLAKGAEAFVFVTDGIASALKQAQTAAGHKQVVIGGGANLAQQCLKAGLVDEIQLHLVHVLCGSGIRLFESAVPVELERTGIVAAPGVTHLKFRVVR